ncbi:MAG TPA: ABC-type transport auxiliary lipoprotein family protein [Kofleriaceae bacterium]|nr:ABC-type transport auxiliary lipoprotein family protein [Kofleriaceae bacterium]
MRRLALLALAGCALTSKSPPLDVHYYTPDVSPTTQAYALPSDTKIRLGRVSAASHLRARIAYRVSPTQIEFYETRRWAESPEAYARRALEQVLAERGVLVTGGKALQLDVEVVTFEEVRDPRPLARVGLRYTLIDNRVVIREGTVETEHTAGPSFDSFVVAIGQALDDASLQIASESLTAN